MIRRDHFFYDLRELLGSIRFMIGLLVVAALVVFLISFQLVYLFVFIFAAIFGARGFIGRRCPHCDAVLKQIEAGRDNKDAFVLYVIWRCPNDGYQEKEEVKGDSGLFGSR